MNPSIIYPHIAGKKCGWFKCFQVHNEQETEAPTMVNLLAHTTVPCIFFLPRWSYPQCKQDFAVPLKYKQSTHGACKFYVLLLLYAVVKAGGLLQPVGDLQMETIVDFPVGPVKLYLHWCTPFIYLHCAAASFGMRNGERQ